MVNFEYRDNELSIIDKELGTDKIEEGTFEQLKNLANLPISFQHVATIPDCHQGYGMLIGGILATKGVVISNAVRGA